MLIDWINNGGQSLIHSLAAVMPLPPNHRQCNDCFSSIRKQAICLYMPRLRIEGPHGVIASKLLALNWSVSLSW